MNKFNILFLHQIQWNFLTTSWNIFCKKIFRDPWNVYCQYAGHPPSQLGKNPKKNLLKFWIGKLLDCYQRFFQTVELEFLEITFDSLRLFCHHGNLWMLLFLTTSTYQGEQLPAAISRRLSCFFLFHWTRDYFREKILLCGGRLDCGKP